eukprot:TRINITY_DN5241_c0_g1_i3.p1 TRINITY_DN5241_c0_g1~~TRINITY_DN5241_c0_g1_i3.p1  ORF type:complete len:115 (-),score=2.99 TRINITY_DN5241_c0_g1_i3:71-415(-)
MRKAQKRVAKQLPSKTCSDSQKSVPKLTITHGQKASVQCQSSQCSISTRDSSHSDLIHFLMRQYVLPNPKPYPQAQRFPVSYTHLTLPTKRIVQISVVAASIKKKQQNKKTCTT